MRLSILGWIDFECIQFLKKVRCVVLELWRRGGKVTDLIFATTLRLARLRHSVSYKYSERHC